MSADDHISREDQILARVFELISKGGRPQINQAVMQVSQVVQANSAVAEQSAATSKELAS